jgi:hypothetical protein
MSLKRLHDTPGRLVIGARHRDSVSVAHEIGLQRRDIGPSIAERKAVLLAERLGRDPMADAFPVKLVPRKVLARIMLAARRDIGMREDALRPDGMPRDHVAAQGDHGFDLDGGEIGVPADLVEPGDLYADRSRIDVTEAGP